MVLIRRQPLVALAPTVPLSETAPTYAPAMEVAHDGHELVVTAEIPGVDPASVNVEIADNALHVSGEKAREVEPTEGGFYRTERRYGRFERHLSLPVAIRVDEASARFRNGVLTIRAPLAEQTKLPGATKLRIESA